MASVETDRLQDLRTRVDELRGIFEVDRLEEELKGLEGEMAEPGFWDDQEAAQKVIGRVKSIKARVEPWQEADQRLGDLEAMGELLAEEEDPGLEKELLEGLEGLEREIERLELASLLSDPEDKLGALLTIHPGAGGTESQDWAEMLFRMYSRYLDQSDYEYEVIDYQPGEEAGIKDAVLEVKTPYAYGYLKAESGVHRLVRISPYDAQSRRHTSFASVFVTPSVDEDIEVEIDEGDLRVDTYRASGAGGQHVNKTSSAVRITHTPTGIVVQSQAERSQHRNREKAMKVLRSRLYQVELEKRQKAQSELQKDQKKIEWGSQIRSYVMHPYTMVKDHRTGVETSSVDAVLDGDLDPFIEGFLAWLKSGEAGG
ncbi:MAG: peptide chain release factor 2 [bacterium]